MTCSRTGKRCFDSARHARRASRKVANKFRVYFCPHCHCFHITRRAGA